MHTIQQIGELTADGIFIYDHKTNSFVYINDAFASIFKLAKAELLKKPQLVLPAIRSEDTNYLQHRFSELQSNRVLADTEFRLHFEDGSVKHLSCNAYLLDNSEVAGFIKDISKEKQHEDYIINYGAKKDTLLDMMTHNLAGPLHLSKNIICWLQQTAKDGKSEEIGMQLQLIQENTKHCLDIVNDFLKQEHIESERIYVRKTRFDVLERIIQTIDKLIATNKNRRFQLITNLESLNISTDSVKFFQIIHNLVSNAIKFTPDNGEIDIIVEETSTTFIVRVKDNGIGIPAQLQSSLFQSRTPSRRTGLKNEASTGLGLSIVKTLVDLLDGRVSFQTDEDKGSVFSIELPRD